MDFGTFSEGAEALCDRLPRPLAHLQLSEQDRQSNVRQEKTLVILGETDWRAIEETLYLNRIHGSMESIRETSRESLSEGVRLEDIDW
uniref:Uncharacterized protein n=1 Tax=Candidatus Kentrum sp. TC TaxID=2126339 RepID=A0A451A2T2_9GAMM|nr:MAG: hypothetical protein BECKTC1821F_GA0114240_10454 [Candidatus Kentron sp. TC]